MTKSNVPNNNPSREGDFFAAFRQIVRAYLSDNVCTADIVQVAKVSDDGTLDLLPVLERVTTTGETLKNTEDDLICGVKPFYFVGGGCEISIPVSVGDFGILLSCKFDIAGFIEKHATADVASQRQFDRSNGVFIPFDFFAEKKTDLTIKRTTESGTDSAVFDNSGITITHAGSKTATIVLSDSGVSIQTDADIALTATGNVNVDANEATITASAVNLGGSGGQPVARVGDTVTVNGVLGTIMAGSSTVKAV
jgi:hypothetical protein